jgi:NADH:ubiquinone oxidoreductase subunit D
MGDSEKIQLQSVMVNDMVNDMLNDIIPQTINTIPEPNVSASKIQNAFRNRLARIKLAEAKAGDVMTQINREREQKAYNEKARIKLAEAQAGEVLAQINREREQKAYNQKAKQNKSARKIQNMFRNKKIYNDAIAKAVERD